MNCLKKEFNLSNIKPVPGDLPFGRGLELATGSKIGSTDRQKLGHSSIK
jgi:hypothetical protein